MLAVADELGALRRRERTTRRRSPSRPRSRLPDAVTGGIGVRVDRRRSKLPALGARSRPAGGQRVRTRRSLLCLRAGGRRQGEPTDRERRRARVLIQPPGAGARTGQVTRLRSGSATDQEPASNRSRSASETTNDCDAGRPELLGRIEVRNRLYPRAGRGRRYWRAGYGRKRERREQKRKPQSPRAGDGHR